MIIVRLAGRLGNLMFQYATGRALSYRLGVSLGLDNYFNRENILPPEFHKLNIQTEIIPKKLLPPRKNSIRILKLVWRFGLIKPKIFHQGGLQYNPKINEVTDNTYLIGYWQSEKFFQDYKEIIRSDFEFTSPLKGQNLETYQEIIETKTAISLHIRRGDYLDQKNKLIHGTCSQEYYEQAVRVIVEQCQFSPTIFVFSDDPKWVTEHFKLPYHFRVVSHNPADEAIEDLRLMTACKHHVIANSSFSWWGAWLAENKSKMIVAPKRWFSSSKNSNPDIYCKNWVRVNN